MSVAGKHDLNNRKDILLLLLYLPGKSGDVNESIRGRTRLMKLLYLLTRETDVFKSLKISKDYTFEPYHYGPFSKEVFEDISFLESAGLISSITEGPSSDAEQFEEEKLIDEISMGDETEDHAIFFEEEVYRLTPRGKKFVEDRLLTDLTSEIEDRIEEIKKDKGALSLSSLLKYVYRTFPEVAAKSVLHY